MVKRTSGRNKKNRVREIDFEGVESGRRSVQDGRYTAEILEVEELVGKESDEPYWQVTWQITSKKGNGTKIPYDNYTLQSQGLFRLKNLLECIGQEVPDSTMDVDMDDLVGAECIVEVTNEKRDGNTYPRVTGVAPLEDGGTVDDEPDSPKEKAPRTSKESKTGTRSGTTSKRKSSKASKDEEEDDGDDDDEDDDEEEDERADNRSQHKAGLKKLKKGASVRFRDEKGKKVNGTVVKIDGDEVTVEDDNEEEWVVEVDELTLV